MNEIQFLAYTTRADLAKELAVQVARHLNARIEANGVASVALSGGRSPKLFMEELSHCDVDWSCVWITLVDERWVDETSPRSNAALVRRSLLRGPAAAAHFVPLYDGRKDPETALPNVEEALRKLPKPFAAVVLGLGLDGHTASYFPDGDRLMAAINPSAEHLVEAIRADGAGEPRITLTLPVLLTSDFIALHIEGSEKRALLARAVADGPEQDLPVRAVLRHARAPVNVLWCPDPSPQHRRSC